MDGTRFRLFPQPSYLEGFEEPETVFIASAPGSVGPGPSDEQMYAVVPADKPAPYGIAADPRSRTGMFLPPWQGRILPPAMPDARGHFDHLQPGTAQFEAAHLFGSVHFVNDIWEGYFGRPLKRHFDQDYERLELSILPGLDNAYAGYGFIEVGGHYADGRYHPFSLNFDVIAHEVGHLIIYGELGVPRPGTTGGEYFGFHESAADLVALVSSLHFNSMVDDLLLTTRGNLYTLNLFNRMAELSDNDEIRIAANDRRLREFARGWVKEHDLSEPLTGAFFDIFVDLFHEHLLEAGLISPAVEHLADRFLENPQYAPLVQARFDHAFARDPDGFKQALLDTRDQFATMLAETWMRLDPDHLSYVDVAETFEAVEHDFTGGRYRRHIRGNFDMRDIGYVRVGPQLEPFGRDSHAGSVRTVVPGVE
jgi:hypothetical protein